MRTTPKIQAMIGALVLALLAGPAGRAGEPSTNWITTIVHPVKDPATHEIIRRLTTEFDPMVREEMLGALIAIGDHSDEFVVRARFGDDSGAVRVQTLYTAAAYPLAISRGEAETFAHDPERRVRAAFYKVLPRLHVEHAADLLRRGVADPDRLVRQAAVASAPRIDGGLALLRPRLAAETDPEVTALLDAELIAASAGAERHTLLDQALQHPRVEVVCAALNQVRTADADPLRALLLRKLDDPQVAIQEEAVRAAERAGLGEAVPVLVRLRAAPDVGLRRAVCEAIGALLAEPRQKTAAAAGRPLATEDATAALARQLAGETDPNVRHAAAGALLSIHDPSARRELNRMLEDPSAPVRAESAWALGGWRDPGVAPVLHLLLTDADPAVAAAAANALGRLQNPDSRAPLLERMVRAPAVVQERIAWALGEFRATEAVPALAALLKSGQRDLEVTVAEALGKIGDPRADPALREVLKNVTGHQADVREKAIDGLLALQDRQGLKRVYELVAERVIPPPPGAMEWMYDANHVRRAGLRYLAVYGDGATAASVLHALTNYVPAEIRWDLARTLTKLTGRPYRPVPDQSYRRYSVESLGPPPFPLTPPPPGVVPE